MTHSTLNYLLEHKDSVDFLPTYNQQHVLKVACGMANAGGGVIVIGMDDDGAVRGVTNEEIRTIQMDALQRINPVPPFIQEVISVDGSYVLVLSVWEGNQKPYSTCGGFYVRVGDCIQKASSDSLNQLFSAREASIKGWERAVAGGAMVGDLSTAAVDRLRNALLVSNPRVGQLSDLEMLKQYGFLTNNKLNNAAVVVAAERPSVFLSQTRIRMSLYADANKHSLISVNLFDTNLIEGVDLLLHHISALYPAKDSIGPVFRDTRVSLPPVALREGILNALVHRSYEESNSFVAIDIYSDRLEIINSGQLPEGITVDSLSKPHGSLLRNPDIANAFFTLKYIEMAGSGTLRILRECRENHCATPFWKSENGCVTLTFPDIHHNQKAIEQHDWKRITSNITSDSSVNESLMNILSYTEYHGNVKIADLEQVTGKSYATVKRYLQMLKEAGLIQYVGSRKTGAWKLMS